MEVVKGVRRQSLIALRMVATDGHRQDDRPVYPPDRDLAPSRFCWSHAREAAKAPQAACTLRNATPSAGRGDWVMLEMTVGLEDPPELYRRPVMAHQRDGGEPLFRLEVQRVGATVTLWPQGRFGEASLGAEAPERDDELGVEYRFVTSAPGVVKLALRPLVHPWKAEARAVYLPEDGRTREPRPAEFSDPVSIHVR